MEVLYHLHRYSLRSTYVLKQVINLGHTESRIEERNQRKFPMPYFVKDFRFIESDDLGEWNPYWPSPSYFLLRCSSIVLLTVDLKSFFVDNMSLIGRYRDKHVYLPAFLTNITDLPLTFNWLLQHLFFKHWLRSFTSVCDKRTITGILNEPMSL